MPNVALIAGNLVSDSGLDANAINAQNYARKHSARDFPNGTLIETTIDYSVTNGDPFVLEITGNSYGSLIPFNLAYQGYIYNNTTINHGGISTGTNITGMSLFNYNGKLCFWFPYLAYWQGFNIYVYIADTGYRENKVTNITNAAKPAGITKEISMTFQQVVRAASSSVGTTNYVAKFTGNVAVGDSQIFDNGTIVGVATTSAYIDSNDKLVVNGGRFAVVGGAYSAAAFNRSNAGVITLYLTGGIGRGQMVSDGTNFGVEALQALYFNSGSAERMRITNAGNVGIGTTSPITNLDVNGSLAVGPATKPASVLGLLSITNQRFLANDPQTYTATSTAVGQNLLNGYYLGLAGLYARVLDIAAVGTPDGTNGGSIIRFLTNPVTLNSPAVERMRIDASGNVGIGTTSPSAPLMFGKAVYGAPSSEDFYRIKFEDVGGIHNDVGIGQPAAGAIGFNFVPFTGYIMFNEGTSNERMRIAAGGNVGIGTSSPRSIFEISAAGNTIAHISSFLTGTVAEPVLRFLRSNSDTNGTLSATQTGQILGRISFNGVEAGNAVDDGAFIASIQDGSVGSFRVPAYLSFGTGDETNNPTERMRITKSGNVGIGTQSPTDRLEVEGNVRIRTGNSLTLRNATNDSSAVIYNAGGASGSVIYLAVGPNPTMTVGTNVGIGTTNPDSTSLRIVPVSTDLVQRVLHIGYNGFMSSGTHGSLITFGNTTPSTAQLARIGAFYEGSTYMGSLRFYTNGDTEGANPSERMRITAAGNVGIGATNPGSIINTGAFFKPETAGEHLDILSPSNEAVINLRSNRDTNGGQVGGIYFTRDAGQGDAHRHIGAIQVRQKQTGTLAGGEMWFFTKSANGGIGVDAARMVIDSAGGVTLSSLAGTGTRIVTADANGFLAASTLSSSIVGGSGTTNYVARWTSSSALGTGVLFDNGSFVGVGITSNFAGGPRLYVSKTTASEEIFRVDGQGGAGCLIISNTASSVQTAFYNGNIGVGTLSPQQKFVVSNVGAEGLEFIPAPSVNSNQIQSYNRSTSSWNSLILRASEYNVQIGTTATLYINGSGNVGVGTTTPNTKLDVVATKNTTGLRLSPSAASAANDYTQIGVGNPGADVDYASIRFTYENGLSNWYNTAISFHTFARFPGNALLERMRINGDGYVGIATSNPLNFLDVYSNNRTSLTAIGGGINVNYTGNTTGQFSTIGFSWAQSIDGATRWGMGLTGTSFASGLADLFFFNGGVERMRITSAGNIGIGATSGITGRLTVSSSLGDQIKLDRTGQTSRGIVISAADNLSIGTWVDPTQISITPSGSVGIGTTSPNQKLEVSGTARISTTVGSTLGFLQFDHPGAQTWKFGVFSDNTSTLSIGNDLAGTFGSRYLNITNAGNIGIGTTSPAAKLDIAYSTNPTTATPHIILTTGGTAKQAAITAESFAVGGLVFSTGDGTLVDRMTILRTNGNVGIGTTTPQAILETYKSAGTTDFVGLRMHNYDASSRNTSSTSVSFLIGATQERARITAGNPDDFSGANGFLTFSTRTSEAVTEKMRITSGGNVGIGTTSPTERLDVRTTVVRDPSSGEAHAAFYTNAAQSIDRGASITLGGGINNAGTSVTNFATISGLKENSTENNTAGTLSFWTRTNGGPMTRKMTITSTGNVGIGTTSPGAILDVYSPGYNFIRSTGGNGGYFESYNSVGTRLASFGAESGGDTYIVSRTNSPMMFLTNNNERIRITAAGDVGIGTTTPNAKLEVRDGDISVSTFNTFSYFNANRLTVLSGVGQILGGIRFQGYSTGTTLVTGAQILAYSNEAWTSSTAATYLSFHTTQSGSVTATERMRVFPNGRVGINTTTDAGYQLDVNGGTRVTGRLTITGNDTLAQTMSRAGTSAFASEIYNSGGDNSWLIWGVESSVGGVIFPGSTAYAAVIGQFRNTPLEFFTNNTIRGSFSAAGAFRVNNLAGTGSRIVVADANGVLSTSASAAVTGSGTTNYISKFTAAGVIGDSQIFDNGTNIGIGTASPQQILHISSGNFALTQLGSLTTGSTPATGTQKLILGGNSSNGVGNEIGWYPNNSFQGDIAQITAIATAFGSSAAGALVFRTNTNTETTPSEKMRITATGNVGIGTASPTTRLHVAGQTYITDDLLIRGTHNPYASSGRGVVALNGTAGNIISFASSTTTHGYMFVTNAQYEFVTVANQNFLFYNGSTEALRITNAGNVGIGTTNPIAKLDVNGSGIFRDITYIGRDSAANDTNVITLRQTAGTDATLGTLYFNTELRPSATGSNRRVDIYAGDNIGYRNINFPYGNVGVGTTTPAARLDVRASTNPLFAVSTNGGFLIREFGGDAANNTIEMNVRPNSGKSGYITFTEDAVSDRWAVGIQNGNSALRFLSGGPSGTERMRLTSAGELLIGTTTDSGDYKLQVSGNVLTTGTITTASPTADPVRPWKLGSKQSATTVLDTTGYVEVEINGTYYRLALVNVT